MFDTRVIARQSLQRADKIKTSKKSARRQATVISSACAAGIGVFFFVLATGILPGSGDPVVIDIEEQKTPLAASPMETQTERNVIICSVCGTEIDEADKFDYQE